MELEMKIYKSNSTIDNVYYSNENFAKMDKYGYKEINLDNAVEIVLLLNKLEGEISELKDLILTRT